MSSTSNFRGENLRLARLMSGFSLQELGERIGNCTRQYIQQLEKDTKTPSMELVEALSYELNVKKDFFSKPIENQIKEEECHFRKLKSTLVKARRECTAKATFLNLLIEKLDSHLDLPEIDIMEITPSNISDIDKITLDCRRYWGLGNAPISSMTRLLENSGVIVSSFGSISEKVDALSVFRKRPFVIYNTTKSAPRIRADLAHEYGHLIMHNGIETGDKKTETEADYFASTLLLPTSELIKSYGSSVKSRVDWKSIRDIKIKWGVSTKLIIYRLNLLGILTPTQYRTANIHLSKTGQTKTEWYDEKVRLENPELLFKSLELLNNTYGNDFGGLLNSLEVSQGFIEDLTQLKFKKINPDIDYKVTSLDFYRNK